MQLPAVSEERSRSSGEPAWEIARLFPNQGDWTADEYLALNTNRLVELADGRVEVLPVPTELHQLLVAFLYDTIRQFVAPRGQGMVLFAPLRVQVAENRFREPDVLFLLKERAYLRGPKFWRGADLVVEVLSEDGPDCDLVTKREEYARAGIAEYWIVDPRDQTLHILTLATLGQPYTLAGSFRRGDAAASILLPGLMVDVDALFSVA